MESKLTSVDPSLDELTAFARRLSQVARGETLPRFASDCAVEDKGGGSGYDPVTEADKGAEAAMRELVEASFPGHGINGEEFGQRLGSGPYSWSLDPIDGTRSYVCGLPTWVTLIGLLDEGQPVLGLIDAPCMDELYVGTGEASFVERGASRSRLAVSACTTLRQARLSTTDPYLFTGSAADGFERLRAASRTVRFGHDGYAYARLAAGTLDLIVECGLKQHDYNALIPVVRGAGGVIGDWRGGSEFARGNIIAAATVELYDAAVAIMRDCA